MSITLPAAAASETSPWLRLRHVSPVLFAGALLALLLPFATVSCTDDSARKITSTSFSGIQLATYSVPTADVHVLPKAGPPRATAERDPQMSKDVENRASAFALVVLLAVIAGLLLGFAEPAGVSLVIVSRASLAVAVLSLSTMAYLALRAVEASVTVDLRSGFWVTSSLLAAVTVVHVNVWRARGGRLRDVLANRFAAGMLIALAWAFSFWLLFLIDVTEVDVPGGTVGTFATGLVVGGSAGLAAPQGKAARLLFAAAAPVVLLLSGWPLTLPIVVIVGVALRRVLFGGGASVPVADHAPAVSQRETVEEPWLRLPRTQVVMLVGVGGYLLGPAIVYFDALSWSDPTREFVKNGPFQLWTAIMGAQTLLWTLACAPLAATLRRHLQNRPSLRREVAPSALILVLLVVTIVVVPAATAEFPSFIPHLHLKVRMITAGATIFAVLASASMWLIRARVERLGDEEVTEATVQAYCRLRGELDRLLAFLGAVVGLAVLGSAELRRVLLLYAEEPNVKPIDFPAENVILYGLILSFVLALVYLPTYATFHEVGVRLREAVAPFPALDELEDGLKRRRTLDDLLGLRVSATTSFRIAAALLSPLLGSVAGILPKLGG